MDRDRGMKRIMKPRRDGILLHFLKDPFLYPAFCSLVLSPLSLKAGLFRPVLANGRKKDEANYRFFKDEGKE
ncbi:hypothetical protein B14911_07203 [Bacillus sp. NRRL B-14911]|nr:hypothetical protein B14911_07203 [Bacillus sp. NRRL B-14911]